MSQVVIDQFKAQARLRLSEIAQDYADLAIKGRDTKKQERLMLLLRLACKAMGDPITFEEKEWIMSAVRSETGIGMDYATIISLVECGNCNKPLPVERDCCDQPVMVIDPILGEVTLQESINNIYTLLQTVVYTPILTNKGRNLDYPATRPLNTYHNLPTLMDFVNAVIFPYSPPNATFTNDKAGQVFAVGEVIPSVQLTLTHQQSSNGIEIKRIHDVSGTLNVLLKEETGGVVTNPTTHVLTNLVLGSQFETSETGAFYYKHYRGYVQDSVAEGKGGQSLTLYTQVDFVYPSFFLKTTQDLSLLSATAAGDIIKTAAPIVRKKGTSYRTGNLPYQVDFNNEFAVFAQPEDFGSLGKISQEADQFTANILNTASWRNAASFPAIVSYQGADGVTYTANYIFYISREKLTVPNNLQFQ
jgi:hypothetical protein